MTGHINFIKNFANVKMKTIKGMVKKVMWMIFHKL